MENINCIYRFKNSCDEIIYIGKAKNLKNRLNSHNHLPKECYMERKKIEFTMFETEDDMDFAERYYIPKIKPKYNDQMKDREITFNISNFNDVKWSICKEYNAELYDKRNNIYYGKAGIRTDVTDIDNTELYTGDVVEVRSTSKYCPIILEGVVLYNEYFYSISGMMMTKIEKGRDKFMSWEIKLKKRYNEVILGSEIDSITYM